MRTVFQYYCLCWEEHGWTVDLLCSPSGWVLRFLSKQTAGGLTVKLLRSLVFHAPPLLLCTHVKWLTWKKSLVLPCRCTIKDKEPTRVLNYTFIWCVDPSSLSPFALLFLSIILWAFVHLVYLAVIALMFLSAWAWRASEQQVCPEPFSSGLFITTVSDVLFQAGETQRLAWRQKWLKKSWLVTLSAHGHGSLGKSMLEFSSLGNPFPRWVEWMREVSRGGTQRWKSETKQTEQKQKLSERLLFVFYIKVCALRRLEVLATNCYFFFITGPEMFLETRFAIFISIMWVKSNILGFWTVLGKWRKKKRKKEKEKKEFQTT